MWRWLIEPLGLGKGRPDVEHEEAETGNKSR
jgi:hypothetical protein